MAFQVLSNLTEIAADAVGHRNPQLLREWQGRLRWRNVLLALVASMVIQGLVLLQCFSQLPLVPGNNYQGTYYCLQQLQKQFCETNSLGAVLLDWPLVWADVFRALSFVLVWVLVVGGVYLLTADLSKETRRGTLNFLRMSPQSSRRILLGKVLGVPVLLYLGIGVMLPLHLATGLMATYPLKILLGFYGLLGAIAACFYAAAMWFALLTPGLQGFQTWLVSGLSLALLTIGADASYSNSALDWFRLFDPLQLLAYWEVEAWSGRTAWLFASGADLNGFRRLNWFFWSAGQGGDEYLCLALPHALLLGAWFWRVLERKFQTPARTSLGKVQSYGLTLFLSLLIMGFNLQSSREFTGLWSYPISMGIYVVMLIFLLLPPHQAVLDWARYRHQQTRGQRSLAYDLLAHDGSPASLAVGVNFGIITGVLLLGISLTNQEFWMGNGLEPLLAWGLCSACLLNCALVVQWITLANLRHGHWITFATAAALILGWPMVLSMLGLDDYDSPLKGLWLTTAFPFAVMGNVVWTEIAGAIAAHLALLSGLSFCLSRRLQYLGQSEWKALQDSRSRPSLQSAQS